MEVLAGHAMHLGCDATEAQIHDRLRAGFDVIFGKAESGDIFALDAEGYDIGAVAAFILRFETTNLNWWAEVARGASPVEILLDPILALPELAEPSLEQLFKAKQVTRQNEAAQLVGSISSQMGDLNLRAVSLPAGWRHGSYSAFNFYLDTGSDQLMVPLAGAVHFVSADGASTAVAFDQAVQLPGLGAENICGEPRVWNFLVPSSAVSITGNRATIQAAQFEGDFRADVVTSTSGQVWLCGR